MRPNRVESSVASALELAWEAYRAGTIPLVR